MAPIPKTRSEPTPAVTSGGPRPSGQGIAFPARGGRRAALVLAVLLTALLLTSLTAAQPVTATGSGHVPANGPATPLTDWSAIGAQAITTGRPPASSQVLLGILHIAMHDTVAALGHDHPYIARARRDHRASAAAAVATAAHDVLVARVPGQKGAVEDSYARYLEGVPDGSAKDRGMRLGRAVATAVLAWRANDGFERTVTWEQPTPGPGVWEPTAPTPPVDLVLTGVRPLALRSRAQFRPDGPLRLTSRAYARQVAEVAKRGRLDSTERSERETETARFWTDNNGMQWARALIRLINDRRLNLRAAARLLALTHVSAADSVIACWDAKYHYVFWRPVHAVTRAGTDGNPGTVPDPTWTPLFNANHPEYPSGHACHTGATTRAIASFFGTDAVPVVIDSAVTGTMRSYGSLWRVRAEVGEARILSGLHFRHAMDDGDALSRRVSRWVARNFPND